MRKTLFTKPAQWVFEMEIKQSTDTNLDIDFHYCPLVKAWQKGKQVARGVAIDGGVFKVLRLDTKVLAEPVAVASAGIAVAFKTVAVGYGVTEKKKLFDELVYVGFVVGLLVGVTREHTRFGDVGKNIIRRCAK